MSYTKQMENLSTREQGLVREHNKLVDEIARAKERGGENVVENVRNLELQIQNIEKKLDRVHDEMEHVMSEEQSRSAEEYYESTLIRPSDYDGGKPAPWER